MLTRPVIILLLAVVFIHASAQEKKSTDSTAAKPKPKRLREEERMFQFSLFPGISSNGIYSGNFVNSYSLNLFGGLSAGNRIFELGLITNLNLRATTGIQFAGLANVVGSNAFVNLTQSEERALIHSGFESSMTGIQVAGFMNYVRTHSKGIVVAGAFNVAGFDFSGFGLSGIGNTAGGSIAGIQLSGLFNVVGENTGGFQVTSLFNYTRETLAGAQLGLINRAGTVLGRKSTPPTSLRGMQFGLFNFSKAMEGLQIGLINFGGNARGMQIGLINFFKRYGSKELVRMGTPIGLLNFGSRGSYFRLSLDELFTTNIEYTTGNCMNCSYVMETEMPFLDDNKIYNQNSLILGYDHWRKTWGFGWGFQKVLFNKFSVAPHRLNEKRVITYGIRFLHLNRDMSFDDTFNLVTRLHTEYGLRWRSKYFFVGFSLNYFMREEKDENTYAVNSLEIPTGKFIGYVTSFWPGYSIGIQL